MRAAIDESPLDEQVDEGQYIGVEEEQVEWLNAADHIKSKLSIIEPNLFTKANNLQKFFFPDLPIFTIIVEKMIFRLCLC